MYYCPYLSPDYGAIPAGFRRRLLAAVVDLVLVMFAGFVLGLAVSPLLLTGQGWLQALLDVFHPGLLAGILYLVLAWAYFAAFESSSGQATIGKSVVAIKVCDLSGEPIGFWRASLRHLAKLLSILTLWVGFFMMLRHPRKQALHDRIAHTLVVINLDSPILGPG